MIAGYPSVIYYMGDLLDFEYKIKYIKRLGRWFQPWNFFIDGQEFQVSDQATTNFLPSAITDSQVKTMDIYINRHYGKDLREINFLISNKPIESYEDEFRIVGSFEDPEIGSGATYRSKKSPDIVATVCWDGIRRALFDIDKNPEGKDNYESFSDISKLPSCLYVKKLFDKKTNIKYYSPELVRKQQMLELYEQGYITKSEIEEYNNEH